MRDSTYIVDCQEQHGAAVPLDVYHSLIARGDGTLKIDPFINIALVLYEQSGRQLAIQRRQVRREGWRIQSAGAKMSPRSHQRRYSYQLISTFDRKAIGVALAETTMDANLGDSNTPDWVY